MEKSNGTEGTQNENDCMGSNQEHESNGSVCSPVSKLNFLGHPQGLPREMPIVLAHKLFLTAAAHGDLPLVKKFTLDYQVKVNYKNIHGESAVFLTASRSFECLKFLHENGADLSIITKSRLTLLHQVAYTSQTESLRYLLDNGLDGYINHCGWDGGHPLLVAVKGGRVKMARMLVEAGADLNLRDWKGKHALFLACTKGHLEMVKLLIPHTSKLQIKTYGESSSNYEGMLHHVARKEHLPIAEVLIEHGVKLTGCSSCKRGKPCKRVSEESLNFIMEKIRERKASVKGSASASSKNAFYRKSPFTRKSRVKG